MLTPENRWMQSPTGLTTLALLALLALQVPSPLGAQVLDRIKDAAKRSVADRRAATEDRLVLRAAEVTDTLAALGLAPVDSLMGDIAAGAAHAITFAASGLGVGGAGGERGRLGAALEAGRADLADVFLPGTAEPSSAGQELLSTLAEVIAERGEPVLLESFSGTDGAADLGERRVRLARGLLLGFGLPPTMVYAVAPASAAGADAGGDGAVVELRVRPLR